MSEWATYCADEGRELVRRVVGTLDADGRLTVARSADALRRMSEVSDPGELGIVVGPVREGVSDVNLAAAIANGGNVRCVVLACESATGSLRSRASRAGIDHVIDLADLVHEEGERRRAAAPPVETPAAPPAAPPSREPVREQIPPERECSDGDAAPALVLCSGRGGVGKTTIAACMATLAARWGMRTCLIDLDLSCGNAYAGFGLSGGSDLASLGEARPTPDLLARMLVSAAPGVSLVGPCARPETAELVAPCLDALLSWTGREFDLVVVDTSTTFTDAVAQAVQHADRLVLVSDDRPGSASALARMSGLAVRLGVARTRIARIENRGDPRARPRPAERPEVGLEAARAYRLVDGGGEVDELVAAGRVKELCEPGYPFADSVAAALAQLLAELGCLPETDEARRAYEAPRKRGGWNPFRSRREAS